ncbi:formate/nitrite transporter family protein [Geminicoccaceae bacterium 1502E]|nr:formate/nitrite transporter family protein [Geminicoccaceae bacterium 1502E]
MNKRDRENLPEAEEEPRLSHRQKHEVDEHRSLSSVSVYAVVRAEGAEELKRPDSSLWWSGTAAGLGISASVLAEGILHESFKGHPRQEAIENLGYTVGFALVILGRLQLFTENTITAILPLLAKPSLRMLKATARLWGIVFAANLTGTFLTALVTLQLGTATPEHVAAMLEVSRHFADHTPWEAMTLGIPAGFFIAALVWMLPSSKGFELLVIMLMTYLIAMGGFTHVIAGSTEAFLLLLDGQIGVSQALLGLIAPTFIGNVLGGTGLFAVLAYGQVKEEI